jgi:tripartite-type tricarboxylate transporter receptor subunit TctC
MISRRQLVRLSAASALAPALLGRAARAQTSAWPNRFVRLVVPFPAGGGADAIARIVAARLSETWGQQVLIENRGGASGNLAAEAVARSAPDGYTMFIAGDFHAVNLFLYPKLSYDPVADFLPVSLVVLYPCAMVVPNSSPARSVKEFIAHAKTNRGKISMASPGHGTAPHLAGELFRRMAGIEMTVVPYRGAAPAIQDVIPGRVDVFFNNIAPLLTLMQQGQLRALAVTTGKRSPAAPDLPTLAEAGMPGFDVAGWYAFFVPANTPPAIVRKMHADTAAALADPSIRERLEQLGLFVIGSTPEELASFHRAEMDKWGPVIKEAGISIRE